MTGDVFQMKDGCVIRYIGGTVPGDWLDEITSTLADGSYQFDEFGNVTEYHQAPTFSEIVEQRLWEQRAAVKTTADADAYLAEHRRWAKKLGWNDNQHVFIYCAHGAVPEYGPPVLMLWAHTVDGGPQVSEGVRVSLVFPTTEDEMYTPPHKGDIGDSATYTDVGVVPHDAYAGRQVAAYGGTSEPFEHYFKCPVCPVDVRITRDNLAKAIDESTKISLYGLELKFLQDGLSTRPPRATRQ